MITNNLVVKIQNLVLNHESRPIIDLSNRCVHNTVHGNNVNNMSGRNTR